MVVGGGHLREYIAERGACVTTSAGLVINSRRGGSEKGEPNEILTTWKIRVSTGV